MKLGWRISRARLVASWALAALALLASSTPSSAANHESRAGLAKTLATEINALRASRGLTGLTTAPGLVRSAEQHARSMSVLGFFSHSSADGRSMARRIASFYPARRGSAWAVGEVLAWSTGSPSAARIVAMWLGSGEHRAQLLDGRWRNFGVGVVQGEAAGFFGGRAVTIVVVDFGRR